MKDINNLNCPFCGSQVEERVKNLTWQTKHAVDCAILEFIIYLCTDEEDESIQILQKGTLEKWNKRVIGHIESEWCWCSPTVEEYDNGKVIIHNEGN